PLPPLHLQHPNGSFLLGVCRQAIGRVHLTINLFPAFSHSNTFYSGWLNLAGPQYNQTIGPAYGILRYIE
ncbi:hypothetical protein VIGAN_06156600, partial [Vigna angularis var. angularis]